MGSGCFKLFQLVITYFDPNMTFPSIAEAPLSINWAQLYSVSLSSNACSTSKQMHATITCNKCMQQIQFCLPIEKIVNCSNFFLTLPLEYFLMKYKIIYMYMSNALSRNLFNNWYLLYAYWFDNELNF